MLESFPIKIAPPGKSRWRSYIELTRIDRPIGTYLLLWPLLWALWIAAQGMPPWQLVAIFVLGTFIMRSAGCAINDYADRNLDGHVARTSGRPLATGAISAREALMVFAVLALCAFGLVLLLNWQTIALAPVGLLLAVLYPFMKRFTHWPQMVLGMAFGWAVPMAFTAVQGALPAEAWLLYLIAILWALVYDTQYAMVDRDDDIRMGAKSTAILFGRHDRLIIGLFQLLVLGLLLWLGVWQKLGPFFYLGLAAASLSALYQQFLIRKREPAHCFKAFLNNNWFGLFIFVGIFLDSL
jgi:4-hydroxybenzoate polyprenyltransferase